jgi:hypothetical protein
MYMPRTARECCADIVVMGSVARSSLARLVAGSTAERVLETLPCDVLLVKSDRCGPAMNSGASGVRTSPDRAVGR